MTKYIDCSDIVEGCDFRTSAPTEEELLEKVKAHAADKHGITAITPELVDKVKAAIRSR